MQAIVLVFGSIPHCAVKWEIVARLFFSKCSLSPFTAAKGLISLKMKFTSKLVICSRLFSVTVGCLVKSLFLC